MSIPEIVEVRQRRIVRKNGVLSGVPVNGPNGEYAVLGVFGVKEDVTGLSKGRPYCRLVAVKPGLNALIEPLEILSLEGENGREGEG